MRPRVSLRTVAPCKVAQRYRDFRPACASRVFLRASRLPLVLRRPLRVDASVARTLVSLAIAPRISLAFSSPAIRTLLRRRIETSRESSRHVERVERRLVVDRSHSATHTMRLTRVEAAVQRVAATIVQRHDHYRRVELPAVFQRVTQTMVRREAAAVAKSEPPAAPHTPALRARVDVAAALRTSTPASIAPEELRRVTNHVISELDRRVLSYRERTGRY
jgi:hypothetical protein